MGLVLPERLFGQEPGQVCKYLDVKARVVDHLLEHRALIHIRCGINRCVVGNATLQCIVLPFDQCDHFEDDLEEIYLGLETLRRYTGHLSSFLAWLTISLKQVSHEESVEVLDHGVKHALVDQVHVLVR